MPSTNARTLLAAGLALVGVLALLYSVVVSATVLTGAAVFAGALVLAVLVYAGGATRRTLVLATMAVTVVYGLFTLQLPVAVIAACAVYLTAWVTGPDSPFGAPDTTLLPVDAPLVAPNGEAAERGAESERE